MCIILYKPKMVNLPDYEILENCFYNNNDGAGYTFTSGKNVIVKKGYKTFNSFYKSLLKDYKKYKLKEHNLIIHFRIGTSGGLTKEKTQPFKISNNIKELNKLYVKNQKSSIVHNGVFYNFTYNHENSDTQNYIKDFLQPLLASNIKDKKTLIKDTLRTSKLAILNKKDKVFLYGEFIQYNGVYYSNNSFNNYSNKLHSKKYDFTSNNKILLETYNNDYFKNNTKQSKIWSYNYNNDNWRYYDEI